ncbi:MarR family winged helix-turn-helix transcriptional regulator [Rhabdothermincola salaria]|uniref:MarR family winged helix-turn-helix transcriptional regulator n=1 Tax=Rhabdothermincola salaria TaxID=2903142 RepID=UPI001E3283D8|nr:MarR family winged helix-turn-helix transcriptional regulator [Rhabdothermincola salaria]MCD9625562.1 MarR family winged helix-turn-helix transcriptional regulator [Rhabdothermincola salaria]
MAKRAPDRPGELNNKLMRVARAHRTLAASLLTQVGLHPGQEALLMELWDEDGRTQANLAAALGVEPPTVTKMLQRMEASGLVDRRPDATDRRAIRVHLTPKGRKLKTKVDKLWTELQSRTVAGLSDRQQASLRSLLNSLEANLTT